VDVNKSDDPRLVVVVGDGECDDGCVTINDCSNCVANKFGVDVLCDTNGIPSSLREYDVIIDCCCCDGSGGGSEW
jgi:hypothetical protein